MPKIWFGLFGLGRIFRGSSVRAIVVTELYVDELEFDQQLGPFYMEHGEEILRTGFEEAVEQLASTMGSFSVKSNIVELHDLDLTIGPYDLTKFIQGEWDKFVDKENPPRRGFLLSIRSPSWAAGRAAEEIVLEKLLWRCL